MTSSLTISATVATEPPRTDPIPIFQLVEKMTARIMAPPNGLLTKANWKINRRMCFTIWLSLITNHFINLFFPIFLSYWKAMIAQSTLLNNLNELFSPPLNLFIHHYISYLIHSFLLQSEISPLLLYLRNNLKLLVTIIGITFVYAQSVSNERQYYFRSFPFLQDRPQSYVNVHRDRLRHT